MSIKRQLNLLGQMRVDVPHLRSIESSIANDFDLLAGQIIGGKKPLIVKGFTLSVTNALGGQADDLQLNVAGGVLIAWGVSEAGSIYSVDDDVTAETLSALNPNVEGSFVSNTTNYIGLDLIRSADSDTSDLVQFLSASSNLETPQVVPLGRVLQYKIVISTQLFSSSSNIIPIAKVVLGTDNVVIGITDARPLMFRLGSGGDTPYALSTYSWGNRTENNIVYDSTNDPFVGEDKSITNLKDWMDATTTTLWEAKGGEHWYSPVNRDNVKVLYGPTASFPNSDNIYFPLVTSTADNWTRAGTTVTVTYTSHPFETGDIVYVESDDPDFGTGSFGPINKTGANTFTYTEAGAAVSGSILNAMQVSTLKWENISVAFENSTGSFNTVWDQTSGIAFPEGYVLYIDIEREADNTIFANIKPLTAFGYSTLPGRRFILGWRHNDKLYMRDRPYNEGRTIAVATTVATGIVKLNRVAGTPAAPLVATIMSQGQIDITSTGAGAEGAVIGRGFGTMPGVYGVGQGATFGGASSGWGVFGKGTAAKGGVVGVSNGASAGIAGFNDETITGFADLLETGILGMSTGAGTAGYFARSGAVGGPAVQVVGNNAAGSTAITALNNHATGVVFSGANTGAGGTIFRGDTSTAGKVFHATASAGGYGIYSDTTGSGIGGYFRTVDGQAVVLSATNNGQCLNAVNNAAATVPAARIVSNAAGQAALSLENAAGSTNLAIDSVGTVQITPDSKFKYDGGRTRSVHLPMSSFKADADDTTAKYRADAGAFNPAEWYGNESNAVDVSICGGIHIPPRATLTSVRVLVNNTDGGGKNLLVWIAQDIRQAASYTTNWLNLNLGVGETIPLGASSIAWYTVPLKVSPVVTDNLNSDGNSGKVMIQIKIPAGSGVNYIYVYGVEVVFTYDDEDCVL